MKPPSPQPRDERDARDARRAPLEWARAAGAVDAVVAAISRHAQRRIRRRRSVVAALLLVIGISAISQLSRLGVPDTVPSFTVAQPVRQVLPDGSVVDLDPEALISLAFTDDIREVRLTGGQAHFDVRSDPARPFVVVAGSGGVRAVGTAFAVKLGTAQVEVLVTSGRVAVGAHATSAAVADAGAMVAAGPPAMVSAGERVVVGLGPDAALVAPEMVSDAERREWLAWRVPRLEFNGTPLGDVIAQFNAHASPHHGERLVLLDPTLRRLPLSGTLRADNIPVLLQILESSYAIKAHPTGGGELVLAPAR